MMGDWGSATYIISQIFVSISYILLVRTYFVTKRREQLMTNVAAAITMGIGFILLGGWVGAAMASVAIARDITSDVIYAKRPEATKNKNMPADWWLLALWISLLTAGAIFTMNGFVSLFAYFATMTFTISIWQKNKWIYNFLGIFVGIFWIIYNVLLQSVAGVVLESGLLAFVIFAFFRYWIKMKK
jgi:hypothetical protein